MAQTTRTYTGTGSPTVYDVDFDLGYISKDHIYVYQGDDYTVQLSYTYVNDLQIQVDVVGGEEFIVRRVVPRNVAINNFTDGAFLRGQALDNSYAQALMIIEELQDGYLGVDGTWLAQADLDMQGFDILNANAIQGLLDTTTDSGAVPLQQVVRLIATVQELPTHFASLSEAITVISLVPENYPDNTGITTSSYRSEDECIALVIPFPDGGGSTYVVEALGTPDELGDHTAGTKQLTLDKTDISPEAYGSNSAMTSSERGAAVSTALGTGFEVSVQSPIEFTVNNAQAVVLLQNIDNLNCNHETNITLPSGEILLDKRVLMSNPTFTKLSITGTDTDSLSITALSETGVDKDHSVTFTVADSATMSVGDYALVFDCQGTGYSRVADGCWKVISKTATTVVVKHTLNASWPAMTVTSGSMWPLKTIIRWYADTVGLAVAGTSVKTMANMVLAGNFDVTTQPPADSAVDGLQVGSSPNTPETGLNESEQMNFGVLYTARMGVVEWEGNATQVYGRLYGVLMSTCSNGWRGQQAGRNGSLIVKSSSSSGNGASGYEAEESGFVLATNSVSAGNAQQGFFTIGGGNINCDASFSIANKTHGLEAKNFSPILADGVTSELNGITGVSTTSGNIIIGSGATIANNVSVDVFADEGGHINAKGAANIGVVSIDYASGASLIQPVGLYSPPPELIIENTNQGKFRQLLSSSGDLFLSFDPSNTGTYATPLAMKPDGTLYPLADGTANMGRSGELFNSMFAYNYVTKSPDGTLYKLLVPNGGGAATWVVV
ncbi:MAG: phage tail fiber protein [Pseudomonadales bacterium]